MTRDQELSCVEGVWMARDGEEEVEEVVVVVV